MEIPTSEISYDFSRSGGPGGQNVNKVETKVRLKWDFLDSKVISESVKVRLIKNLPKQIHDGKLVVESTRFRSREQNIKDAMDKLTDLVGKYSKKTKKRVATNPSRGSKEKQIKSKKIRSAKKQMRRSVFDE